MLIDETGGMHGIRDHGAVLNLVESPKQYVFGKELYPSVFEKAAVYLRNTIQNHPFVDGNKRTAMTAAAVFLEDNGFMLKVKEGQVEKFALRVAVKKLDIKSIAHWLNKYSKHL